MSRAALFLDRDGTLVYPSHYPSRPEQLRLYEDIGPELVRLQRMGFLLIVVTNQAGIARGYFTEADLQRMHKYLAEELIARGVRVDGIYHCPHHPEGVVPEFTRVCECRKPGTGMILRAAREHQIDVRQSWLIGDILDDVEAGNRAGCRTILVDLGTEQPSNSALRQPTYIASSTSQALRMIIQRHGTSGSSSAQRNANRRGVNYILQRQSQEKRPPSSTRQYSIYCPPSGQYGGRTSRIAPALATRGGAAHGYRY